MLDRYANGAALRNKSVEGPCLCTFQRRDRHSLPRRRQGSAAAESWVTPSVRSRHIPAPAPLANPVTSKRRKGWPARR